MGRGVGGGLWEEDEGGHQCIRMKEPFLLLQ